MGDFKGHAAPATFMLIIGVLFFLRSLDLKFLSNLRRTRIGLISPAVLTLLLGVIVGTGEFIDMTVHQAFTMSHFTHLRLDLMLVVAGIIQLLFMTNKLAGPFWPFAPLMIVATVGTMFFAHHQDTALETYGHQVLAYGLYAICITYCGELFAGMHMRKEGAPHPSRDERSRVAGVHWVYTNPALFDSVFPMLNGVIVCLNASLWYGMAYCFYVGDFEARYPHADDPERSLHYMLTLLYDVIIVTLSALVVLTLVLQLVDKAISRGSEREGNRHVAVPLTEVEIETDVEKVH